MIEDQFQAAMDKVDQVVAILEPLRRRMSLSMRVILANVFIASVLAYPCRHYLIPERLLKTVEGKIARFSIRVPFCKIGFLAQARALYGVRPALRDVRPVNVAALLSTYHARTEVLDAVGCSMQTLPEKTGRATKPQLQIPAVSWMVAMTCYTEIIGLSAMDIARGWKPTGGKARNQERGNKRADGALIRYNGGCTTSSSYLSRSIGRLTCGNACRRRAGETRRSWNGYGRFRGPRHRRNAGICCARSLTGT